MGRVLLAAEADRIQDLVFRSSRLREVTGGSYALERFWRDVAALALEEPFRATDVPVAAGGNLRALFEGPDAPTRAERFGRALADLYRVDIGGSVSVAYADEADLLSAPAGEGADAWLARHASAALARAKAAGRPPEASPHLPYLRPCSSCGRDAAVASGPTRRDTAGEPVRCAVCTTREELRDTFQGEFLAGLRGLPDPPPSLARIGHLPEMADAVGALDPRRRVAYLLADGNGFGVLFDRATQRGGFPELTKFSNAVREAGTGAVADATAALLRHLPEADLPRPSEPASEAAPLSTPVLPLITGGDDVFVLLPAPWAIWFADQFARGFRARVLKRTGETVSVGCALVFCKATFPYRFAHQVGERALREAKRASRALIEPADDAAHAIPSLMRAVEVRAMVSGAELGPPGEYGVFSLDGGGGALHLQQLLDARRALRDLRAKRRHEMEALYAGRGDAEWAVQVEWLLGRIERMDGPELTTALRTSMTELAQGSSTRLCRSPLFPDEGEARRSAIVDLLHHWDYLHDPIPEAQRATREPLLAEVAR